MFGLACSPDISNDAKAFGSVGTLDSSDQRVSANSGPFGAPYF